MEKKDIKEILEHPVYTTMTRGEERFRGLLGEFFEARVFEDEGKIYSTPFQDLQTVEDVENLLKSI